MAGPVFVLDTSAIIYGFNPQLVEGDHYMPPSVRSEVVGKARGMLAISISSGRLKVRLPQEKSMALVKSRAVSTGDAAVLSNTDLEVVALALELKQEGLEPIVISDDYSLQNLCNLLGITFKPMVTRGISQGFWWFLFCPACGATYERSVKTSVCRICGHGLKRKVYSKKKIADK